MTVYILTDHSISQYLRALRSECDYFKVLTHSLEEKSCAIDLFENSLLNEYHKARFDKDEYFKERWKNYESISKQDKKLIQEFIISTIPNLIHRFCAYEKMYIFNEHYIVKNKNSTDTFSWHRDAEKQLISCMGDRPEYVSVWMPLDDVNELNGSIAFPRGTDIIYLELISGVDVGSTSVDPADNIITIVPISDGSDQEPDQNDVGIVVTAKAGQCILFSSNMYHRSGPNMVQHDRRVFYAQYSQQVITGTGVVVTTSSLPTNTSSENNEASTTNGELYCCPPLSFAVPCVLHTHMKYVTSKKRTREAIMSSEP